MKRNKIVLPLIALSALSFIAPTTAIANNVRIRTDNASVTTYNNGGVRINTDKTNVSVPSERRSWYPWRNWRTPWQSNRNCYQSSYQHTSQTRNSNEKTAHYSSVSSHCR